MAEELENKNINGELEGKNINSRASSKKVSIGIAAVVALIILIGAGFLAYSLFKKGPGGIGPDKDVAEWEIYNNLEHGFSIKYPASWVRQEGTTGLVVAFVSPKENDNDAFQENLNVVVQDLSSQPMTLDEYNKLSFDQLRQVITDFDISESGAATLANNQAYELIYTGRMGQYSLKWHQAWTIKNNKAYVITYTAEKGSYPSYLSVTKEMVKSFEFTAGSAGANEDVMPDISAAKDCGSIKIEAGETLTGEELLAKKEVKCLIDAAPKCKNVKIALDSLGLQSIEYVMKKEADGCFYYMNVLKGVGEGGWLKCEIEQNKEKFTDWIVSTNPDKLKSCSGPLLKLF